MEKKKISIKQSKGVEQLKLSDAVRAVKWYHPFGQLFAFLYPTSWVISPPDVYPSDMQTDIHNTTCTRTLLTGPLRTTVKSCKTTQTSFKRRILSILPQHSCHVFIKWSTTQQRKGTTDWYTRGRWILKTLGRVREDSSTITYCTNVLLIFNLKTSQVVMWWQIRTADAYQE